MMVFNECVKSHTCTLSEVDDGHIYIFSRTRLFPVLGILSCFLRNHA